MRHTLLLVFLLVLGSGAPAAASSVGDAGNFTLKSAAGSNIRLSEYRGQVVMLNFWASWCGPCRQEFPHLDEIYRRYADLGFTVFGINVEQDRTQAEKVLRDIPVTFPILFDDENEVSELYGVDAMPMTMLLDRNGVIRHLHRGYRPGYEQTYEAQVRELVKE